MKTKQCNQSKSECPCQFSHLCNYQLVVDSVTVIDSNVTEIEHGYRFFQGAKPTTFRLRSLIERLFIY